MEWIKVDKYFSNIFYLFFLFFSIFLIFIYLYYKYKFFYTNNINNYSKNI